MEHYDSDEHINVGTGEDLSIGELAERIRDLVAPGVAIDFDASKPDGHRESCSTSAGCTRSGGATGRRSTRDFASTYEWFCAQC